MHSLYVFRCPPTYGNARLLTQAVGLDSSTLPTVQVILFRHVNSFCQNTCSIIYNSVEASCVNGCSYELSRTGHGSEDFICTYYSHLRFFRFSKYKNKSNERCCNADIYTTTDDYITDCETCYCGRSWRLQQTTRKTFVETAPGLCIPHNQTFPPTYTTNTCDTPKCSNELLVKIFLKCYVR